MKRLMTGLDTELDAALKAMEASFHVRLIGTFDPDLIWAPAGFDAAVWLAQNCPEFDQFPVKERGATVSVLLRAGEHKRKYVHEVMEPLREGLIVSADMTIADMIPQLRESHYRLVLRGGRIDGLVKRQTKTLCFHGSYFVAHPRRAQTSCHRRLLKLIKVDALSD